MIVVCFLISFIASTVGAVCGVGGGVIIKPVLDLFRVAGVSTVSFLSGCTVLSMTCYSVCKNLLAKENRVDFAIGTPLAVGAALGGVLGKQLFSSVKAMFPDPEMVGCVQALCLAAVTLATFVYTLKKASVKTLQVSSKGACVVIGLALGLMSSFLGIGGGPINLVVLFFFFSMETKTAAQNSLYIILFSQIASLVTTVLSKQVPDFEWSVLLLMIAGGIGGGIMGRSVTKKLNNTAVDRLFLGLMAVIIGISIYNAAKYFV